MKKANPNGKVKFVAKRKSMTCSGVVSIHSMSKPDGLPLDVPFWDRTGYIEDKIEIGKKATLRIYAMDSIAELVKSAKITGSDLSTLNNVSYSTYFLGKVTDILDISTDYIEVHTEDAIVTLKPVGGYGYSK